MSLWFSDIERIQQEVIDACQIMYKERLWEWFGEGHPSARIPRTDRVLTPGHVHPFGNGMRGITSADDLVVLDASNYKKVAGRLDMMGEAVIHLSIMRSRTDVGGVVYAHPLYCDVFAELNQPIPCYGENIPIWDSQGAITTIDKGNELVKQVGSRSAILLRNPPSLVTLADNVRDATVMVYMIEKMAARQYRAMCLGDIPKSAPKSPLWPPQSGQVYAKYERAPVELWGVSVDHPDIWRFLWDRNVARK